MSSFMHALFIAILAVTLPACGGGEDLDCHEEPTPPPVVQPYCSDPLGCRPPGVY